MFFFLQSCNRCEPLEPRQSYHTLRVASDSNGTIIDPGEHLIVHDGEYELIAGKAAQGYVFSHWTVTSGEQYVFLQHKDSSKAMVKSIRGDARIKAVYTKKKYWLKVISNPSGGISQITQSPEPGSSGLYAHGKVVKIKPKLNPGWKLNGWSHTADMADSASVELVSDTTITINLSPLEVPEHVICVKKDAAQNGGGTPGTNWVDAYHDLHSAVDALGAERNTIWVAQGDYEITAPVELPANSSLIGGFAGNEVDSLVFDPTRVTRLVGNNTDAIIHVPQGADNVFVSTLTIESACGDIGTTPYGGIYAAESHYLILRRCVIMNNEPVGLITGDESFIDGCVIAENTNRNTGADYGAGIKVGSNSTSNINTTIRNTIICNNVTNGWGAAVYVPNDSNIVLLINSTIANNESMSTSEGCTGGILGEYSSNLTIANCIIWGNTTAGETSRGTQIKYTDVVTYSNIQDHAGGGVFYKKPGWEMGNKDTIPVFINEENLKGSDGYFFTPDDGLMLGNGSGCVDAAGDIPGYNDLKPQFDIRGYERGRNPINMGAYDGVSP